MMLGVLILAVMFFFNFMAGKASGMKESQEIIRDLEMQILREELEELKRSKF